MKGIILSEETQTQKYKYYLFSNTGSAIPQFINFIPLSASETLKTQMEITAWSRLYLFPQYSQKQLQPCTLSYIALILMKRTR